MLVHRVEYVYMLMCTLSHAPPCPHNMHGAQRCHAKDGMKAPMASLQLTKQGSATVASICLSHALGRREIVGSNMELPWETFYPPRLLVCDEVPWIG